MIAMLKRIQGWWRERKEREAFYRRVLECSVHYEFTTTTPREDGVKTWTIDELLAEPYEKEAKALKGAKG